MSPACRAHSPIGARSARDRASARRRAAIAGLPQERGLSSLDQAQRSSPTARRARSMSPSSSKPGRPTPELIADILPGDPARLSLAEVDALGRGSTRPDALRWVRPLHSILCAVRRAARDPGDRAVSRSTGSRSGDTTYGHRFMAPDAIKVRRFEDYVDGAAEGEGRARRRPPQGHHPRRRARSSRSRTGSNSSRTRGCWRKSPASSNGRSC